jgi:hypothetical protein
VNWFTFAEIKYLESNIWEMCPVLPLSGHRALQSVEIESENFSAVLLLR